MKDKILLFLFTIKSFIAEQYQKSHNKWLQQQQEQQIRMLSAYLYDMVNQMTIDLYEALHAQNNTLESLKTPQAIRFIRCFKRGNSYQYQFTIDKKSCDKIPAVLLGEIQDKMNSDIASTQRNLINLFGYDYVYMTYPFLYHGIYIVSIQDLKVSSVVITVQTNLTPQDFCKIYRQIGF